ncbi:hypothetical protein [Caballeronia humi]|uniref:Uncharacterized protein n=1 Tax=Caballeronia humi TaxID=326474 RepID=A0A158HMM8_9BURK|nr:hypothetical protein [Caballeronia humi]SAL45181.1 hypothetical protein AWB65_03514 [Caballeronia humi]
MATELKTDSWHRYVLYRSSERYMPFVSDDQRQGAIEAGRKFTASAYADVWARDPELVARVRGFLGNNFHWHERLAKSGTSLDVVQTLMDMVRSGSVVLIAENLPCGGPPASGLLPASNAAINFISDPETIEAMRAFAQRIAFPPGEPVLSGPYRPDRQAQLETARAALTYADADTASLSTPLGDATPFELVDNTPIGDPDLHAAGFRLTPGEENECMSQYDIDMDYCSVLYAMKPSAWGVCKERAADRLGRCLAGKGAMF